MSNMPFQIHGEMYHIQGPIALQQGEEARYAQLYIYDPQYAASVRYANNSELDRGVIQNISRELHEVNYLVRLYRYAHEILSSSENVDEVIISPSMKIELLSDSDRKTENLPSSNEVAVIIPNESSSDKYREIHLYLRNSVNGYQYTWINQSHTLYMPSHYTLLFPRGEYGWHWGLKLHNSNRRLKQREYYRFRLH